MIRPPSKHDNPSGHTLSILDLISTPWTGAAESGQKWLIATSWLCPANSSARPDPKVAEAFVTGGMAIWRADLRACCQPGVVMVKKKLDSLPRREAAFIEPMECALVPNVPDGPQWVYEIKLDGYRAIAVKSGNKLALYSRRRKSFNRQFAYIAEALGDLPEGTVIDGEIVVAVGQSRHAIPLTEGGSSRQP
jgi:hypothetical protein